MSKVIVTNSGGMDSAVLLYMAAEKFDKVYPVTFDYRQKHRREMGSALKQVINLETKLNKNILEKTINVAFIRDVAPVSSLTNDSIHTPNVNDVMGEAQPRSYVPFRNLMFLSILCSYAESIGAEEVWYGAAQADSLAGYWDGSEEFLESINELISLNRSNNVRVVAPLIEMSKKDIILKGIELGVKFEDTYTCYSGEVPCDAESASSSLRLKGFIEAGFIDPLLYKQQDKLNKVYKDKKCKMIEGTDYTNHMRKGYPEYL
jgi:7-cyano-7-deazaguanine synthase